eukprot:g2729.t1
MLPNEQVYERINGIWNLSSDQGNLGTFIITNVRTVWFAVLAENFNVSIPYLQMKSINVRMRGGKNSKFGQALVIETTASSGGYILGFRADPVEHLEEVYTQIHNLWILGRRCLFPLPYLEDDVQIMEGDEIEPCLLYQPDGEKELDREPIFNNELGLARSDLDLLTTKPLVQLLQVLRSSKGCPLELVEYVASARVPRLRLRCGQVELDVVEGGRDPEALAKDQFIRRWLEDESVKGLAMKIKDFTRRNEKELPHIVRYGSFGRNTSPRNFFLFLLTGLYFVQRKKEALSSESSTKRSAEELFRGWLTWLADATPKEVDLRDGTAALAAIERAESALRIVEPVSGRTVCSLSAPNAQHLAALATLHLATASGSEQIEGIKTVCDNGIQIHGQKEGSPKIAALIAFTVD